MLTSENQFLLASLPSTLLMEDCIQQFNNFSEYISMQVNIIYKIITL
jgi:hypothetical protein